MDVSVLVWGDGYYNGSIKTRKTVHARELTPEEFGLQRSQQLRDLYDTLSNTKSGHQSPRKPSSLNPEDLAETEWFFLVCMSCSFAEGVGYMPSPFFLALNPCITHSTICQPPEIEMIQSHGWLTRLANSRWVQGNLSATIGPSWKSSTLRILILWWGYFLELPFIGRVWVEISCKVGYKHWRQPLQREPEHFLEK